MKLTEYMIVGAVCAILGLVLMPFTIIGPGQRGVSTSFGTVNPTALKPGVYFKAPIVRSITKLNVQIQKSDIQASAATKDMQEATTHAALNWHISPDDVATMYTNIGDADDVIDRVIIPTFNEVLKSATAKKTAEEVIARRNELKQEVDHELKLRLEKYGVYADDLNIVDVKFGKEFTEAIEAKQVAEQRSKQAIYEAQQAENMAKGEVAKARGQAEANRLLQGGTSKAILQMKAIEKWDGKFPQVMGTGTLPFINITAKDTE